MQKVFVGLSGGVDSAVSAALLQREGYDVTGAFIKIWSPEYIECTWKEDRLDAMRVCAALGIPFREIDLSDEYRRSVVNSMIEDYARGITPNPDVLCNRHVKFGAFSSWAFEQGADLVATGHYAQIRSDVGERISHIRHLVRGIDHAKDQSYFLYRLGQEDLARILFPVGGISKSKVRDLAREFGLPNAQKHDSQGLCFVGQVSMKDFLSRYIALERGPVVDETGKHIGSHDGVALYTIGQRHGFDIEGKFAAAGPHYVIDIDVSTNTLTVSLERATAARAEACITDVHWIGTRESTTFKADVQTRYHESPVRAIVHPRADTVTIEFSEPHIASPGQSLVIYHGDTCLGGGVILK